MVVGLLTSVMLFTAAECSQCFGGGADGLTVCGSGGGGPGSGPGGGGGPPSTPVPTPDPYTWIENLPLSGDTPTYSTTWCQLVENPPSCPQYLLYWHGRSFDSFGLIDAGTYTMDVGQVGFAFYVLCCPPWQWDATSMATTLYNQHSAAGTYTYDITCPTLSPPPPPNMEGWCLL